MSKEKKKPDLSNAGVNPLTAEFKIPINKREYSTKNKFGDDDHLEFALDASPFTKVFEVPGYRKRMIDLPVRGKEMLLYIIHTLEYSMDCIWIDKAGYMELHGIKSINTFKEAIKALSVELYIYPHATMKDVYWINPKFFFKGSRTNKYPNKCRVITKKTDDGRTGTINKEEDQG